MEQVKAKRLDGIKVVLQLCSQQNISRKDNDAVKPCQGFRGFQQDSLDIRLQQKQYPCAGFL